MFPVRYEHYPFCVLNKRTMDNIQNCDSYIIMQSSLLWTGLVWLRIGTGGELLYTR
jgi:hypothetical protein